MMDYQRNIKYPFDVPIHKRGHGNKALEGFMGKECTMFDFNSSDSLDKLQGFQDFPRNLFCL